MKTLNPKPDVPFKHPLPPPSANSPKNLLLLRPPNRRLIPHPILCIKLHSRLPMQFSRALIVNRAGLDADALRHYFEERVQGGTAVCEDPEH